METGSSLPWQETLRLAIGENRLDATAVRDYFRPLEEWLRNENLRTGEFVGWVYGKFQRFLHYLAYSPRVSPRYKYKTWTIICFRRRLLQI